MKAARQILASKWIYQPAGPPVCSIHNEPARWVRNRARESGGQWACCRCTNYRTKSTRQGWKQTNEGQLKYYLRQQYWAAKSLSKSIGREFTITIADVTALWEKQGGKCAITGDEMEIVPSNKIRNPNKFSLDRIDSDRGYTPDNIQYLCEWVNRAKQNLTADQLIRFAKGVLRQAGIDT